MVIEINSLSGSTIMAFNDRREVTPVNHEPNQKQQETGKSSTGDTISLTESAKQLRQLEVQANAQPVVDIQRVDETRRNIANGRFSISPTSIAQKLTMLEDLLPA